MKNELNDSDIKTFAGRNLACIWCRKPWGTKPGQNATLFNCLLTDAEGNEYILMVCCPCFLYLDELELKRELKQEKAKKTALGKARTHAVKRS
jgi:hypothetical protein